MIHICRKDQIFSFKQNRRGVITGDMVEFQRCRKGPGVNTGGLVYPRGDIYTKDLRRRSTYV